MRSTLAYSSARILLFLAVLVVLYLIGARGLVLLALALLVSGILSFVVLYKARDRMSASLSSRLNGRQEKRQTRGDRPHGMRAKMREFSDRLSEGAQVEDEDTP
jgi:hypothetical protein